MNELNRALSDISSIRKQLARSTEFRGYGPATLAATGVFAFLAAGVQALWIPLPAPQISEYVSLWCSTALLSALLAGVQMYTRSRRIHSGLSDEMIHMAVEQFLPAVGAGLLLTVVFLRGIPGQAWMLPGLWQVIFSLGIFASCRFLPRLILLTGVWYLLTGLICIGRGENGALSPWAMAIPFGVGQMLVAVILLIGSRKRTDES